MDIKAKPDAQKTNLHIMDMDKFIPPFIKLIEEHRFSSAQIYFISGSGSERPPTVLGQVVLSSSFSSRWKRLLWVLKTMNSVDRIILHGLFNLRVVILLFFQPWLLKRCYWMLWGGDLYSRQKKRNFKWWRSEFFRVPVIRNLGAVVVGVPGEYGLVESWYKTKARHIECMLYTSNMYREYPMVERERTSLNVQVGNSADPTNNHLEIFDKLDSYKHLDIKVYVPLAYGDDAHRQLILVEGRRRFGDKFLPLLEMLEFDAYLKFLSDIDIAIFAHSRQQAFGNKITLLGLGKKVVFRSESTLFEVFKKRGIAVFDFADFDLQPLPAAVAMDNKKKIKEFFSKEALLKSMIWLD